MITDLLMRGNKTIDHELDVRVVIRTKTLDLVTDILLESSFPSEVSEIFLKKLFHDLHIF